MDKEFFEQLPSIEDSKKEQIVYGRLFIPYTLNGFYIMGADKIGNDYKLFVVEKWNTPFVLKVNYREVFLSELINKYDTLTFDKQWCINELTTALPITVKNLYKVQGV